MSLSQPASSTGAVAWQKAARRARVPLGLVAAALYLAFARPTGASLLAGLPLVLGGLALRGYASGYLSKNRLLATTGPYAHTRNPLYLGSLILVAGFALVARNPALALGLAVLFAMIYAPTIASEERYLRTKFPEFDAYARAVPRLVPRLAPARLGGDGGFSRALFLKHREYNAWIGAAAMVAALAARIVLRV